MSENPVPFGKGHNKSDLERIAHFMNGFLGSEILQDIQYPQNLQKPFEDLNADGKREWFEITFRTVFKEAAFQVVGLLKRQLKVVELNLIKRRIMDYLKTLGVEYKAE